MAQWVTGTVVESVHWTPILFSLKIEAAINPFKAGQFTSLALDVEGERIARPYTFVNTPGSHAMEFFLYAATQGRLSNALVTLKTGDSVWVKQQPNGFFILDEIPQSKDLWMIATGTGIAPFMSILKSAEVWEKYKNVILVQAVRTKSDLLYQDSIDGIKSQHPQSFVHQVFVSRQEIKNSLPGRVTTAIENGDLERAVGIEFSLEDSQIMLCGNPGMTKESLELLKARGFTKNRRRTPGHLTTENYW